MDFRRPFRLLPNFQGALTTPPGFPGILPNPPDPSQTSGGFSRPLPNFQGAFLTPPGNTGGVLSTPTALLGASRPLSDFRGALQTPPKLLAGPPDPFQPLTDFWRALPSPPGFPEGPSNPFRTSGVLPISPDPSRTSRVPPDPSRTFGWALETPPRLAGPSQHLPDFPGALSTPPRLPRGPPNPSLTSLVPSRSLPHFRLLS